MNEDITRQLGQTFLHARGYKLIRLRLQIVDNIIVIANIHGANADRLAGVVVVVVVVVVVAAAATAATAVIVLVVTASVLVVFF